MLTFNFKLSICPMWFSDFEKALDSSTKGFCTFNADPQVSDSNILQATIYCCYCYSFGPVQFRLLRKPEWALLKVLQRKSALSVLIAFCS